VRSRACLCTHGQVVFDELLNYCGFENHEALALYELVEQCGLEYEWIGMQQRGRMQAALRVTAVRFREAAAAPPATAPMPRAAPQQLRVGLEPEQSQPSQPPQQPLEATLDAALLRLR
jgi:hypothetical protein